MSEIERNSRKAWDAGYNAAFHYGLTKEANPYRSNYAHNAWTNGYREGEKDKRTHLPHTYERG